MNYANGWHVLYVKSRWERRIYEYLKEINLEPFLPQLNIMKKWSDRKKIVSQPLFPSYVFVNINSSKQFHQALSVEGVCCYIRFGKEYARVTEKEIEKMKFLVEDKNLQGVTIEKGLPKVGDLKKIIFGPLNDLECEILKVNNTNKIIVRIESLQQNFTATLPADYLCDISQVV